MTEIVTAPAKYKIALALMQVPLLFSGFIYTQLVRQGSLAGEWGTLAALFFVLVVCPLIVMISCIEAISQTVFISATTIALRTLLRGRRTLAFENITSITQYFARDVTLILTDSQSRELCIQRGLLSWEQWERLCDSIRRKVPITEKRKGRSFVLGAVLITVTLMLILYMLYEIGGFLIYSG